MSNRLLNLQPLKFIFFSHSSNIVNLWLLKPLECDSRRLSVIFDLVTERSFHVMQPLEPFRLWIHCHRINSLTVNEWNIFRDSITLEQHQALGINDEVQTMIETDDEQSFIRHCDNHPDIIASCCNRTTEMSYLRLVIEMEAPKIASYLAKRSINSLLPEDLLNDDVSNPAFRSDNLNIINVLYALAEVGREDLLNELFASLRNESVVMTLVLKLFTVSYRAYEVYDRGSSSEMLSCLEVMLLCHRELLLKVLHLMRNSISSDIQLNARKKLLRWSCKLGDDDLMQRLQTEELKSSVDEPDDNGLTLLHLASCYNHVLLAIQLIDSWNADVHATSGGCLAYPIAFAAALGHLDVVNVFVERRGTKLLRPDAVGRSLHAAAAMGCNDVIQLLLDTDWSMAAASGTGHVNGEQTDVDSSVPFHIDCIDEAGNTALLVAANAGRKQTVETLVSRGANVEHQNKDKENVWNLTMKRNDNEMLICLRDIFDRTGRRFTTPCTVLHDAIRGKLNIVDWLIDKGIDPSWTDGSGNTALHVAALGRHYLYGLLFKFKFLAVIRNSQLRTALHQAAVDGDHEVVDTFKSYVPESLYVGDGNKRTALHLAAMHGHLGVIKVLAEKELFRPNDRLLAAKDSIGRTPLHLAVLTRHFDCVKELKHSDPDIEDDSGCTCLHLAAATGSDCSALVVLLEQFYKPGSTNRRPNSINDVGLTALMMCALNEKVDGIKMLLERGASIETFNSKNGENIAHILVMMSVHETLTPIRIWNAIVASVDDGTPESRRRLIDLTRRRYGPGTISAVQLASVLGAVDMLKVLIDSTSTITIFEGQRTREFFDMGDMIPGSLVDVVSTADGNGNVNVVVTLKLIATVLRGFLGGNPTSCLELICHHCKPRQVVAAMRIEPFRVLLDRLSWIRTSVFAFIFTVHIIYMSLFTAYVALGCDSDRGQRSAAATSDISTVETPPFAPQSDDVDYFIALLVWPVLMLAYEAFCFAKWVNQFRKFSRSNIRAKKYSSRFDEIRKGMSFEDYSGPRSTIVHSTVEMFPVNAGRCRCLRNAFGVVRVAIDRMSELSFMTYFEAISHVSSLVFCILIFVWYHYYRTNANGYSSLNGYEHIVAVTVIYGWLHSLEFIKGFSTIHAFVIMVKIIFYKDVLRILFIYSFVIVGFASATQIFVAEETGNATNLTYIAYQMYGQMVSAGSFFDTATSDDSTATLSYDNVNLVRSLMAVYLLITTVVLMNILIAAMNQTFKGVVDIKRMLWCVDSLNFVVWIAQDNWLGVRSAYRSLVGKFIIKILHNKMKQTHIYAVEKPVDGSSNTDSMFRQAVKKKQFNDMREGVQQLSEKINFIDNGLVSFNDRLKFIQRQSTLKTFLSRSSSDTEM
jgi:ankyrin repeat protein